MLRSSIELTSIITEYIGILDSCFHKQQADKFMSVYRMCNYREMSRSIINGKYLDRGYLSSSTSIDELRKFVDGKKDTYEPALLKINIPLGTCVLDIERIVELDSDEKEILFKRNSQFEINKNLENSKFESLSLDPIWSDELENFRFIEMDFDIYIE